jgi:hypothetical protein
MPGLTTHFCDVLARQLAHLKTTVTIAIDVKTILVLLSGNGCEPTLA